MQRRCQVEASGASDGPTRVGHFAEGAVTLGSSDTIRISTSAATHRQHRVIRRPNAQCLQPNFEGPSSHLLLEAGEPVDDDGDRRPSGDAALDDWPSQSHVTSMALSRKKATTIALDPEDDRLLSRAARERGVSRSEFIRQHLALVLEQYRRHPKPRSAGVVRALTERGDERELFSAGR